MSELEQAILRLESHEKECKVRYEMIQMQLDQGDKRFDKLERMITGGFALVVSILTVGMAVLEFSR